MTEDGSPSGNVADLSHLSAFIERLTVLVRKGGLTSLEIKSNDLKVKIRAGGGESVAIVPVSAAVEEYASLDVLPVELTGSLVTSPMVGTFYHSASPSEPPLIQVGDRVEVGQVIGIIEAMKIMNEIASDRNGLVVEIIAPNGTAVEYGSPLVRVAR